MDDSIGVKENEAKDFAGLFGECVKVEETKIIESHMSIHDRSGHQMNLCHMNTWFSELWGLEN